MLLYEGFSLSPSAADICIICHIDITVKYPKDKDMRNKLRLWKDSITKTKVYLDVEKFLREEIQRNRDFQCICQSCYKKVMTNISSRREYQESFQEGQKVAAVQFSRIRTKCSSFDKSPSKTSFLNSVAVMNNMGKQFWIKKSRGWWYVPMLFSYFVAIVPYRFFCLVAYVIVCANYSQTLVSI